MHGPVVWETQASLTETVLICNSCGSGGQETKAAPCFCSRRPPKTCSTSCFQELNLKKDVIFFYIPKAWTQERTFLKFWLWQQQKHQRQREVGNSRLDAEWLERDYLKGFFLVTFCFIYFYLDDIKMCFILKHKQVISAVTYALHADKPKLTDQHTRAAVLEADTHRLIEFGFKDDVLDETVGNRTAEWATTTTYYTCRFKNLQRKLSYSSDCYKG